MSEPFVSPYLLRPLRGLDEVRADRARDERFLARVLARVAAERLRFGPRPLARRGLSRSCRRAAGGVRRTVRRARITGTAS